MLLLCMNLALDPRPLDLLSVEQIKQKKLYQPLVMLLENEQPLTYSRLFI